MSDTTSSGGFSSASAYCLNWLNAASRSLCGPLYSHAKQCRLHTSAQPLPPVSLRAPRSKQYRCPLGSSSTGVGSPSSRHRSMKCSCAADRSFNSDARHLPINSCAPISMPPSPVSQPLSPSPFPYPLSPSPTPYPAAPTVYPIPPGGPILARQKSFPPTPARCRPCWPFVPAAHLAPRALQSVGPASARFLLRTGCPLDQSRPQPMPLPTGRPKPTSISDPTHRFGSHPKIWGRVHVAGVQAIALGERPQHLSGT